MLRPPPRSTLPDTLFPYTPLLRARSGLAHAVRRRSQRPAQCRSASRRQCRRHRNKRLLSESCVPLPLQIRALIVQTADSFAKITEVEMTIGLSELEHEKRYNSGNQYGQQKGLKQDRKNTSQKTRP